MDLSRQFPLGALGVLAVRSVPFAPSLPFALSRRKRDPPQPLEEKPDILANDRLMDFESFLQTIRADPHYAGQIAHVERLPARPPRYAEPAQPLPAPLPGVLAALGIE